MRLRWRGCVQNAKPTTASRAGRRVGGLCCWNLHRRQQHDGVAGERDGEARHAGGAREGGQRDPRPAGRPGGLDPTNFGRGVGER
eukprot:863110-Rhodomonas_salina.1